MQRNHIHNYLILFCLAAISLAPIGQMILTSFKTQNDLLSGSLFFTPTLSHYGKLFQTAEFSLYLWNSIYVATTSTIICIITGAMAAYSLSRFRFKGRNLFAMLTLFLRTVPLAVLAVPVFLIWASWGLTNSLFGLILLYCAVNLPFTIWILYGFFDQLPEELEEAALMDGANYLTIFVKIILPLIMPGLAAAAIFTFRIAWNDFILAFVLTDMDTRTISVAASLFITDVGVEWGKIMALGTIIALPPLLITIFFSRHIIGGLTAGAVK
ncbi:MAG: carbohydrate ABC transporter permease [Pseudomonadota bacterium]